MVQLREPVPIQRLAARVATLARCGFDPLAGLDLELMQVAAREPDVDVAQHDRTERLLERLIDRPQLCVSIGQLLFNAASPTGCTTAG